VIGNGGEPFQKAARRLVREAADIAEPAQERFLNQVVQFVERPFA